MYSLQQKWEFYLLATLLWYIFPRICCCYCFFVWCWGFCVGFFFSLSGCNFLFLERFWNYVKSSMWTRAGILIFLVADKNHMFWDLALRAQNQASESCLGKEHLQILFGWLSLSSTPISMHRQFAKREELLVFTQQIFTDQQRERRKGRGCNSYIPLALVMKRKVPQFEQLFHKHSATYRWKPVEASWKHLQPRGLIFQIPGMMSLSSRATTSICAWSYFCWAYLFYTDNWLPLPYKIFLYSSQVSRGLPNTSINTPQH